MKYLFLVVVCLTGCSTAHIDKDYDSMKLGVSLRKARETAEVNKRYDDRKLVSIEKGQEKLMQDFNDDLESQRQRELTAINEFYEEKFFLIERWRSQDKIQYWDSMSNSMNAMSNNLNRMNTQNQLNRIEQNQSNQNYQLQQIKNNQPAPSGINPYNR